MPADFRPTSVTFVGTGTGWVIGQASTPGHCATQYCTSVARTDDAGRTWAGVPAPLTGAPDGATGVNRIRFLNTDDGWAFGPELWVTHTGGKTWTPVDTHGLRVTDLETVGSRVFALWASCTGGGHAYAARCTSFTLYSAPAAGGSWAPVGAATTGLTDGAAGEAASLALTGSRRLPARAGRGAVRRAGRRQCAVAAGELAGLLVHPRLAPGGWRADRGAARRGEREGIVRGLPVGQQWRESRGLDAAQAGLLIAQRRGQLAAAGPAPAAGVVFSLAAGPSGSVLLATDQGIDLLPRGEIAWRTATLKGGAPAGGFGYVGMTTDDQGIALPADPSAGTVWFTFDGGQDWQPSRLGGT